VRFIPQKNHCARDFVAKTFVQVAYFCKMIDKTTVLLTACGRPDLLHRTLSSLNTSHPLTDFAAVWVHEDFSGTDNSKSKVDFPAVRWINPTNRQGHMRALNALYRNVTTPFIFHCEDDWEFYGGPFLAESYLRLNTDSKCLQVWLRAHDDTNGHAIVQHPRGPQMSVYGDCPTPRHNQRHNPWRGFSLNPGLRRAVQFASFDFVAHARGFSGWRAEKTIGEHFYRLGYYAAITANPAGYCRHIGEGRHQEDTGGAK
jgi:hypothetical protein